MCSAVNGVCGFVVLLCGGVLRGVLPSSWGRGTPGTWLFIRLEMGHINPPEHQGSPDMLPAVHLPLQGHVSCCSFDFLLPVPCLIRPLNLVQSPAAVLSSGLTGICVYWLICPYCGGAWHVHGEMPNMACTGQPAVDG